MATDQETDTKLTDYEKDVLRAAQENHIWLNAFSCIRPTPEFLQKLGANVLHMLKNDDLTILAGDELSRSIGYRDLIVRINKS